MLTSVWIAFTFHGELAGEWVVGGIEAKVPAYAFALWGLSYIAVGRFAPAWWLFGAAAAFHVLVGGWSVVAAAIAFAIAGHQRPSIWRQILPLMGGGLVAAAGVVPGLWTSQGVDSDVAIQAANIYTFDRIAHHLYAVSFSHSAWTRFAVCVAIAIGMFACQCRVPSMIRIGRFTLGSLLIAAAGLLLSLAVWQQWISQDRGASLLRFYWFRLSDVCVPLLISVGVVTWLASPLAGRSWWPMLARLIPLSIAILAAIAVLYQGISTSRLAIPVACHDAFSRFRPSDDRDGASETRAQWLRWVCETAKLHPLPDDQQCESAATNYAQWRDACRWAHDNTPPGTMFITPRHQQTFKFYSLRGEVANRKDVPQNAAALIDWQTRMQRVYPDGVRADFRYDTLAQLKADYGAEY
ncbi:MAG: DUF6798 domain-containing protein, partial [Planctomycetota bacterium]